jgi:hypothetical protein
MRATKHANRLLKVKIICFLLLRDAFLNYSVGEIEFFLIRCLG